MNKNQYRLFNTSIFTQAIFKRQAPKSARGRSGAVILSVACPIVEPCQHLAMVGSAKELGEWDVCRGVKMLDAKFPIWESPAIKMSQELAGAEFKFVIVDSQSNQPIAWEVGDNRVLNLESAASCELEAPIFDVSPWRGCGVAVPVFSLRSEDSWGVGDFTDLKKMVDWAACTGQQIIQILPINDTMMSHTWEDSYPYNANSIFALHPQYLAPLQVAELSDASRLAEYMAEARELNSCDVIDYPAVMSLKDRYLREVYQEQGDEILSTPAFKQFFKSNKHWLESYALFSVLRDKCQSADTAKWGDESEFSAELLARYTSKKSKYYKQLAYHYFLQYNLHLQLLDARDYAHSKGIGFKGDIPIGVSRTSVDVWVSPELFHLDSQTGAPPDDFAVLGQNWGFPTYNWQEMAKDGYAWWSARFKKMAEYFDAYRIDHILGFFRIWEIPLGAVDGLLGHFSPALPFSAEEMLREYGFRFDESYVKPAINRWLIDELFWDEADAICAEYLNDDYTLKAEYDEQIKIKARVHDKELSLKLMSLLTEVLFVEDPYKRGYYHPRITAQQTYKYRAMSEVDKRCYDRLYNDFFYRRHNDFWMAEAMAKLPSLVGATDMLTCGEDLGMIPACVPQVMNSEQILSLEIQRMPKAEGAIFGNTEEYPYTSVCTTSTHDMSPLRAWLLEDEKLSQHYLNQVLEVEDDIGSDVSPSICETIVRNHLDSPAMWTILPVQDWLSIDSDLRHADPTAERINIPANPRHYWRYRMHIGLEALLKAESFNKYLRDMIEKSGRGSVK